MLLVHRHPCDCFFAFLEFCDINFSMLALNFRGEDANRQDIGYA